jgi:putative copper export protein
MYLLLLTSTVAAVNSAALDVDAIRVGLHLLAMAVWVGGQIIMVALLPVLRSAGEGVPTQAAAAFGRAAWPAYVLAVATGIWNLFAVDLTNASTGYNIVFGIKFLLVIVAGAASFVHQRATSASLRGASAGIGFLASLVVVVLGAMMAH